VPCRAGWCNAERIEGGLRIVNHLNSGLLGAGLRAELKHISKRRNQEQNVVSPVAASEQGAAGPEFFCRTAARVVQTSLEREGQTGDTPVAPFAWARTVALLESVV